MLAVTSNEIMSWTGGFLWPLFRISALIGVAPVFGARTVPVNVKLALSLLLTLVVAPLLPAPPAVDPLSGEALLITLNQILIGSAMGLALQLVFSMFVIGGQIIAFQMGLGFASMVDPGSGTSVPVVGQFYVVLLTLLFLALDGHLVFIDILVDSFRTMPIGMNGLTRDGFWTLAMWGSTMYAGAVQIALPAIAALMLINLTFGVVTRSAPQFNVFAIGFPVTILAGFFIMLATLTAMLPQVTKQLSAAFDLMRFLAHGGT